MTVKYELMVGNGTYQKEGETKTNWLKVGRIMETSRQRLMVKLDCLPTTVTDKQGNNVPWEGWINVFPPRESRPAPRSAPPADEFSDDIGF